MSPQSSIPSLLALGSATCLGYRAFVQAPLGATGNAPALRGASHPVVSEGTLAGATLPGASAVVLAAAAVAGGSMVQRAASGRPLGKKKAAARSTGSTKTLEGEKEIKVNVKDIPTSGTAKMRSSSTEPKGAEKEFAGGLIGGQSAFSGSPYNFDPLGLSEKFPEMLPFFRESELKHGRIAMLGFVGLIAPEFATIPGLPEGCANAGLERVKDISANLRIQDAHNLCIESKMDVIDISPMMILLLGAGLIEVVTTAQKITFGWGLTLENAGDYPYRKEIGAQLNQLPKNERDMTVLKLQELKNGRLAMIAFGGAITQAVLCANGFPWIF